MAKARKTRKKGGFTLVEAVIALTIVVAVSITALSIVLSSIVTKAKAVGEAEAQSFAADILECFKVSDSNAEFLQNVSFSEGITLTPGIPDENGYSVYIFTSAENKFTAQIKLRFMDGVRSELNVSVTDEDGDGIVSFSYKKGDGV